MSLTTLSLELIESIKQNYALLKKINFSNNGLVNIDNISQLPSLTTVDLSLNQVVDLRPLLALSSLTDLNLHSNLIGDANVLGQMRSLVRLDLSNNCIYTADGVQELANIPTLCHLNLEGNPCCSHISYPYNILSRITSLETLDDKPVKELRQRAALLEHGQETDEEEGAVDRQRIELQDQVEALERALHLQEQALSSNIAEELQWDGHVDPPQFPFLQMLSTWRLKVVELLVSQEQQGREQRLKMAELVGKLRAVEENLQREAAQVQTWQERCAVAQSQKKLLKLQLVEAQEALQQEMEQAKHTANNTSLEKNVVRQLHQGLAMAKRFVDRHGLRAQATLLEMTRRMDEFAARIKIANERIEMMQHLIEQKESHLRNLTAAFEAERRLWHHRKAAETSHPRLCDSSEFARSRDNGGLRMHLKPEVEGILRSVFCACDENDCGSVAFTEFHDAILNDDRVAEMLEAAMGEASWQQFRSILDRTLRERPAHQPDDNNDDRITWGEFLLEFVDDSALPDKQLDRCEIATLLRSDVSWSVDTWALVALQLPHDASVSNMPLDHLKADGLHKEVGRLARERQYLLARLQSMSRQNVRVFQNVRTQYDNELHSLRRSVSEGKLAQSALEDQVRRLTARLHEIEQTSTATIANLQQRLREMEAEKLDAYQQLMQLKQQQQVKTGSSNLDLEAELKLERARLERLESEHRVLKRETSRTEVRCRTLEKENSHLRTVEQQKLDAYTVQQDKLTAVQKERNNLLAKVVELEEFVKAKDDQIAKLASEQQQVQQQRPATPPPAPQVAAPAATLAPALVPEQSPRLPVTDPIVQRLDRLSELAERLVKFDSSSTASPNSLDALRSECAVAIRR